MTTRQYPELPAAEEMFPRLLPWAMNRQQYRNDEAREFCAKVYHIDDAKQRLLLEDGKPAWMNYFAHTLKRMTQRKLHMIPEENDGIHYRPDHAGIRAFLTAHPPGPEDNVTLDPLAEFVALTSDMPRGTEAERWTIERIGQQIFRKLLISAWRRRCPVTEIDDAHLLTASHIKPWACCETDEERMDPDNGLLLAAHIDAAFDEGLLSFSSRGDIILSQRLSVQNARRLGVDGEITIPMSVKRETYMKFHRRKWHFETARVRPEQEKPSDVRPGSLFG